MRGPAVHEMTRVLIRSLAQRLAIIGFAVLPEAVLLATGCKTPPQPKPHVAVFPPTRPDDFIIEPVNTTTDPNGKVVGTPGPDDDLALRMRHKDGRPWVGWPVNMTVTTGSRALSLEKAKGPYFYHFWVLTDSNGVARVYLEPLPTP